MCYLNTRMIEIREYLHPDGSSPYSRWFHALNAQAAVKVTAAVVRMEHGNLSCTKSVGGGVFECKIDFGPGYRLYFGKDGERLIILLGGGMKKGQNKDIQKAKELWVNYKRRKKEE